MGIDLQRCRGLGFDGASNMSGTFKGAQAILRKRCPMATYFHCTNHRLDLAIQEVAREETFIYDTLEFVRQAANFVRDSGKRLQDYKDICADLQNSIEDGSTDYSNLATICPTRWVVRVKGIRSVIGNFER